VLLKPLHDDKLVDRLPWSGRAPLLSLCKTKMIVTLVTVEGTFVSRPPTPPRANRPYFYAKTTLAELRSCTDYTTV